MKKIKQRIREWYLRSIIIDGKNPQILFFFIFMIGAIDFSFLLRAIVYFLGLNYFLKCVRVGQYDLGKEVKLLAAASESRFFIIATIGLILILFMIITAPTYY